MNRPVADLSGSLLDYLALLRARQEALTRLSAVSAELLATLHRDPFADVTALLDRREEECRKLGEVRPVDAATESRLLAVSREIVNTNRDRDGVARAIVTLNEDCASIIDQLTRTQMECEEILKAGLAATAQAMRQSAQRRKLDSAYGPAFRHESAVFLDKQQ